MLNQFPICLLFDYSGCGGHAFVVVMVIVVMFLVVVTGDYSGVDCGNGCYSVQIVIQIYLLVACFLKLDLCLG